MVKRSKNIIIWSLIIFYLIVALGFVAGRRNTVRCEKINIEINGHQKYIQKQDIINYLNKEGIVLKGKPIDSINIYKIEQSLAGFPVIKNPEAFKRIDGSVTIKIEQRKPLVRIINDKHESFYIDSEGVIMPVSNKYTFHLMIANGNITTNYKTDSKHNIFEKDSSYIKSDTFLRQIFTLAQYINKDKFWNAQIEQIYVNENKEFELIPRVGSHTILLGKINGYEKKFRKLKTLYMEGLRNTGWNQYKTINLKYKNQVVCTKR